jgi:hypothetical protein
MQRNQAKYYDGQAYILVKKVEDEFKAKEIICSAPELWLQILQNLSAMGAAARGLRCSNRHGYH